MKRPVVLITGASRGLGRGVALSLAPEGYDLAIHYASNEAAARETAEACRQVAKDPAQKFITVSAQLASSADRTACCVSCCWMRACSRSSSLKCSVSDSSCKCNTFVTYL